MGWEEEEGIYHGLQDFEPRFYLYLLATGVWSN